MKAAGEAVLPAPAVPRPIRVDCVDTLEALTSLRPEWDELLGHSAADGPFLTWAWLHSWWTHLHGANTLKVVTIREGAELIAIAPLMVTAGALPWLPCLEFLGTGHAGSDYLDAIVRIGREAEALRALAGFLQTQNTALRLDHLPETSASARLSERLASEGWVASSQPGGVCPVITLAGHTWESYLGTLGPAHRANVRRRLRALEQQFQMRFERVTSESQRRAALETLVGCHERRFRIDGGSTAFLTPALRAFQHEATRRALDGGWLRMYVLWLNETPAAVMYGFFYNRQFAFYQHGFDERYGQYSVGVVLMALTLRAAIVEGAQTFDLLWGAESYKWLWTKKARTQCQIRLFPPHASGRVHRLAVETRRHLGALVRRVRPVGGAHGPASA